MTAHALPRRLAACALIALAACQTGGGAQDVGDDKPALPAILRIAPTDSESACYGEDTAPAVIETVTEQVLVTPASATSPARYRTETNQKIVRPRRTIRVETPCDAVQTIAFTASLQRALKARGYYDGAITAIQDAPTRAAIRAYQSQSGLDSAILSVENARELGLIEAEL